MEAYFIIFCVQFPALIIDFHILNRYGNVNTARAQRYAQRNVTETPLVCNVQDKKPGR